MIIYDHPINDHSDRENDSVTFDGTGSIQIRWNISWDIHEEIHRSQGLIPSTFGICPLNVTNIGLPKKGGVPT